MTKCALGFLRLMCMKIPTQLSLSFERPFSDNSSLKPEAMQCRQCVMNVFGIASRGMSIRGKQILAEHLLSHILHANV